MALSEKGIDDTCGQPTSVAQHIKDVVVLEETVKQTTTRAPWLLPRL